MKPKPKRGRPAKPAAERMDETLPIRLRVADKARIEEAASRAGVKASDWAREVLLRSLKSKGL